MRCSNARSLQLQQLVPQTLNLATINTLYMNRKHVNLAPGRQKPFAYERSCESRVGQIGNRVANGSPPLRRTLGAVSPRRQAVEMDLVTRFVVLPRV